MEMTGEQLIAATQQAVWDALNDPEVLKACIPGCESIDKTSDTQFSILMLAAVGPVKARFKGNLTIGELDPPRHYKLSFEGSGGAAGFGKGSASVSLADEQAGTRLSYVASAQVGGKLAQVGSRLIDGVARKMAEDFFNRFNARFVPAQMHEDVQASLDSATPAPTATSPAPAAPRAMPWKWALVATVAAIVAALVVHWAA